MFKLRYYQEDGVDSIYNYFASGMTGNPVVAQPTGTGKSLVIAGFLKKVYQHYPTQRVMMLTHVKELIVQNFDKLMALWPTAPAGIYSAGLNRRDTHQKITFAGIQSVAKKPELFGHIDLIIIDECDLVSPKQDTSYRTFIAALKKVNPYLKVIGLSATPFRLGMGMITDGGLFTDICYDDTGLERFNELIDEGYIIPLIPRRTKTQIDVTGVHKSGGEFKQNELQAAVDKDEITYNAVKEMVEEGGDRKHWLLFATGIEHCYSIARILDLFDIESVIVHSNTKDRPMSDKQRDDNIRAFASGKVRVIINNNILTVGHDFPFIDLIGALRPTSSARLWIQMLGRGTRPDFAPGYDIEILEQRLAAIAASNKQNCLVFDFAANTVRNGPINDPIIPKKKGSKGGGIAPVRECEMCRTYVHASLRVCPNCGFEFPKVAKIFSQSAGMELIAKTSIPIIETFKVSKIIYTRHRKLDKPDSIMVTYYCGLRRFKEWICLEHGGYPGKLARNWWRERSPVEPPETTEDALENLTTLTAPTHIKVWLKKKNSEIKAYDFTGRAFETVPDTEAVS